MEVLRKHKAQSQTWVAARGQAAEGRRPCQKEEQGPQDPWIHHRVDPQASQGTRRKRADVVLSVCGGVHWPPCEAVCGSAVTVCPSGRDKRERQAERETCVAVLNDLLCRGWLWVSAIAISTELTSHSPCYPSSGACNKGAKGVQ